MQSIDSARILSVLQDTNNSLRLLSYVSYDVLDSATQLYDILGEEVTDALVRFSEEVGGSPDDVVPDKLHTSVSGLLRLMKRCPGLEEQLEALMPDRSPAMISVLQYFQQLQDLVTRRLGTTVEEDAYTRETQLELQSRQEQAALERRQLEQKLKLQRVERAKQMDAVQSSSSKLAAQLGALRNDFAAQEAAAASAATAAAAADQTAYEAEHARLSAELAAAQAELTALRDEARSGGSAQLKARRRAAADCEAAIQEYDSVVGDKLAQADKAQAELAAVQKEIEEALTETEALRSERVAWEDAQRAAADAARRALMASIRKEAAVYLIQNAWKMYKKRKAAETKKGAGGKEGGKKGKK